MTQLGLSVFLVKRAEHVFVVEFARPWFVATGHVRDVDVPDVVDVLRERRDDVPFRYLLVVRIAEQFTVGEPTASTISNPSVENIRQ